MFKTCCFSYSCSCFSSFSYFISYSRFMNTAIHISFPIFFLFHAYYIWHFIYLYSMMSMYSHIIHVFSSLYESILLRNGNHSNWIFQTKVMAFHAKLVNLPILPEGQFVILIFQCLDSIFDTGSLYSFKPKVLRVLLQLESPKSKHRNSRYVRNIQDYSMIKTEAEFGLNIAPIKFLGHI